MMNLALNNATNVEQYYKDQGEKVEIEVVTFGPGLHMLRDDTSPVKDRIKAIAEKSRSISFKACGNTQDNMHKAENKDIPLVAQATLVKSGGCGSWSCRSWVGPTCGRNVIPIGRM